MTKKKIKKKGNNTLPLFVSIVFSTFLPSIVLVFCKIQIIIMYIINKIIEFNCVFYYAFAYKTNYSISRL